MNIKISNFNTRLHKAFGEQRIIVEASANINGNIYQIEYYRSPITGELQNVTCLPIMEADTNENTLTIEAVQDYCSDELQS